MKDSIIEHIGQNVAKEFKTEAKEIVSKCDETQIKKLYDCMTNDRQSGGQTFFMELDFIKAKLVYFGRMKNKGGFGISLDLIPDLITKWKKENKNKL